MGFLSKLNCWYVNSIHKPPALPVRIEKVLPLPKDHGSKPERCRWLMNGVKTNFADINLENITAR